jgi:hypothetical protein
MGYDSTPDTLKHIQAEWSIKVCPICGRRTAPLCQLHPDEGWVTIRVVPKDIERFHEEVGGDA